GAWFITSLAGWLALPNVVVILWGLFMILGGFVALMGASGAQNPANPRPARPQEPQQNQRGNLAQPVARPQEETSPIQMPSAPPVVEDAQLDVYLQNALNILDPQANVILNRARFADILFTNRTFLGFDENNIPQFNIDMRFNFPGIGPITIIQWRNVALPNQEQRSTGFRLFSFEGDAESEQNIREQLGFMAQDTSDYRYDHQNRYQNMDTRINPGNRENAQRPPIPGYLFGLGRERWWGDVQNRDDVQEIWWQ
ncbi:hypothetical protein COT72_03430, partial [archaeon CG10_big_fil_rev_8_21_14_0_10_43_11]